VVTNGGPSRPKGSVLYDDCLKLVRETTEYREVTEYWGARDGYTEQAFRVAREFIPELVFLLVRPFCLLLLGAMLGWVFGGFKNIKPHASE
jgi:hypothetical protein